VAVTLSVTPQQLDTQFAIINLKTDKQATHASKSPDKITPSTGG